MAELERVIKGLEVCFDSSKECNGCPYIATPYCKTTLCNDVTALLKEQDSLLGIQQTADGITFISTGTARQGEERGILLGKSLMHEWIYKELLYKGLLTDDIRSVFEQAKRI